MYACLEGEIKSLESEIKNLEGWQIYQESFFLAWSTKFFNGVYEDNPMRGV
jgi:hypothetical protein